MIGQLSFLSPWWLAALPAVAAGLVYIYRRRASQRTRIVSTLLLLKDFTKSSTERAKVEFPLRFFLELAALLLIVFLLAGIKWGVTGEKIAVIVDDSLSTQARANGGDTLYAVIKKEAQDYVEKTSVRDSFDLYRGGKGTPEKLDISGGELQDLLDQDPQSFEHQDQMMPMIESAIRTGYDKVAVFTDKKILKDSVSKNVQIMSVREALEGNSNVALERAYFNASESKIHATLRSFSDKTVIGHVVAGSTHEPFAIGAGESLEVAIPAEGSATKEVEVKLETDVSSDNELKLDDAVRVTLQPAAKDKVFVVSELSESALGLSLMNGFSVARVSPSEYEQNPERYVGKAVVFQRFVPRKAPHEPALYVLPGESPLFSSRGIFSNLTVTRWDSSHPVSNYLHLDLLTIPQGQTFTPLSWQQVIVSTEEGPLLLSGEQGGVRTVVSGLELFPFRGKGAPVLSITMLNVLKWLQSGDDASASIGFFSEEESDLAGNIIDASSAGSPGKPSRAEIKNPLRSILLLLVAALCFADMIFFALRGRPVGGRA